MAIYRFEAKIISRRGSGNGTGSRSTVGAACYRTGRCATSAAAYRAGAELTDERTGQRYDYTAKRGVMGAAILLPVSAPGWMADRSKLWNAVERIEQRRDAQLARDFILSLPHELSQAQRVALTTGFVQTEFVAKGFAVDIAWHSPEAAGGLNHHAHVMVPLRRIGPDGFARLKERPAAGVHPANAWRAELLALRQAWEMAVNRHLAAAGIDVRVDRRSLAERGIDRVPQAKRGLVIRDQVVRMVPDARAAVAAFRAAGRESTAAPVSRQVGTVRGVGTGGSGGVGSLAWTGAGASRFSARALAADHVKLCHDPLQNLPRWLAEDKKRGIGAARGNQPARPAAKGGQGHGDDTRQAIGRAEAAQLRRDPLSELRGGLDPDGSRGWRLDGVSARQGTGMGRYDRLRQVRAEGRTGGVAAPARSPPVEAQPRRTVAPRGAGPMPAMAVKTGWSDQMKRDLAACVTPADHLAWSVKWAETLAGRVEERQVRPMREEQRGIVLQSLRQSLS